MQSLLSPTSGTPPIVPKIKNQFFPARSGDSGHNPTPSLHLRNPPPLIIPRDEEEVEEKPDTESYPKPIFPVLKPASLCSKVRNNKTLNIFVKEIQYNLFILTETTASHTYQSVGR
jgi:hypothetical protein